MGETPTSRQISLDGRVLCNGVKRASASTDEPILAIAHGRNFTFVALREAYLVVSWRFRLPTAINGPLAFGIPPMIVSHLNATPPSEREPVILALNGSEVGFTAHDFGGQYELRWRFDLRKFPVPPELNQLLAPPPGLVAQSHLQVADSIHQAVARLMTIQAQQQIHRTKLAIAVSLSHGQLLVDGQQIQTPVAGQYYFDPRLMVRALEIVRADQIQVGLTELDPRRAFLSIVDQQPDHVVHCALLSLGMDTQRLVPPLSKSER